MGNIYYSQAEFLSSNELPNFLKNVRTGFLCKAARYSDDFNKCKTGTCVINEIYFTMDKSVAVAHDYDGPMPMCFPVSDLK